MTWDAYGEGLDARRRDLETRIHRGSYRAQPSLRAYIPKPDGRQRPLGIAALEDKIVQRAVVEVLSAIHETDFLGFSYGFRPGRGQHDALDALAAGIENRAVNWILDADIKGFFDNISHERLMRFVEHRVGDRRVLRLIRKWLKAGVVEDGIRQPVTKGTPQGAVVSPPAFAGAGYCWRTSTSITSTTCGPINGGNAMRAVRWSWCDTPTTPSLVLSIEPEPAPCEGGGPNGSWRTYASGWRNSTWSYTPTRPG